MNADLPHPMLAAPFGAPVRGMQVSDSGITPGLIVVDSSRSKTVRLAGDRYP